MKNIGLKLTIVIGLILLIAVIILVNISLRQIPEPKTEPSKKELKTPEKIQIFELPPEGKSPTQEAVEEEKPPEVDIKDIPFEKLPKKTQKPRETIEEEPATVEPAKELRTQPTPEELRQIKQKGLIIY